MNKSKLIKTVGYITLAVSCILFLLILAVPWLNITKKQMAIVSTVLLVAGEILFYTSLFLIGKSFMEKLWKKIQFWKKKPDETISIENEDSNTH